MADENEINKEESANSLTRDSSNQVGGNKYFLRNKRSQTNAVNMPDPDEDKKHRNRKNRRRKTWDEKNALEKAASTVARELRKAAKGVKDVGREMKQTGQELGALGEKIKDKVQDALGEILPGKNIEFKCSLGRLKYHIGISITQ